MQDKRAASLRGPKTVEVTRAVEASEGAQSLGSAQRTVRPTAKTETVGVVQREGLAEGPRAVEATRAGRASDSARFLVCAQHTVRPAVRAVTVGKYKRG